MPGYDFAPLNSVSAGASGVVRNTPSVERLEKVVVVKFKATCPAGSENSHALLGHGMLMYATTFSMIFKACFLWNCDV